MTLESVNEMYMAGSGTHGLGLGRVGPSISCQGAPGRGLVPKTPRLIEGVSSSPALRSITVHRFQPRWGWLGMAGDDWGWLGEGGDGGDGSFVTEITYGKFIN